MSHGAGFRLIAFACMIALAFTAVPAPLWPICQKRDGSSTFMITVVFAACAVGVIIGLFLVGHMSDRRGRRRVLMTGVLTEAGVSS
ncbi:MFS transporter [Streptomyces sp. NPDC005813]|uniref:MFS transporter n=1 Tax=Streptomyces sp. NPDC005813 TaxID=3155592 RepID=UPI0033F76B65